VSPMITLKSTKDAKSDMLRAEVKTLKARVAAFRELVSRLGVVNA